VDRQDAKDARDLEEAAGEVDALASSLSYLKATRLRLALVINFNVRPAPGSPPSRPLCPSISLTLASLASWRFSFSGGVHDCSWELRRQAIKTSAAGS
jgi:hypothetical protein